ncbi:hypothetical protein [Actinokineospora pegani]|uniref:hypothetical protein n=1 Tax=Actinokineospora pegani TaxID=2654637 RepID=UPI0012EA0DC9|nr:hypothetical protein [Actinokineospora pegani]
MTAGRSFTEVAADLEAEHTIHPLLALFAEDELVGRVRSGATSAAVGLFRPNALFSLSQNPLQGIRDGADVVLDGGFQLTAPGAEVALVAVALDGGVRLALLPSDAAGVRVDGGVGAAVGAVLRGDALSEPVSLTEAGPVRAALADHAWRFAAFGARWCAGVIADLRRTLAVTGAGVRALSTSQYLAHELSKLEIEVNLAGLAAEHGAGSRAEATGGQAVAAVLLACTDLLHRTVVVAEDMTADLGLADTPVTRPGWPGRAVLAHFGGRRMVEAELARRMGLVTGGAYR